MRMMWLFIILGVSGVVAVLAILAMYARVRRHMKSPATHEEAHDPEI
jgi:hypothetical protein